MAFSTACYMCACPAQVASEIRHLRELIRYQRQCLKDAPANPEVHVRIAASAREAHDCLEACLDEVLRLEGWDRQTLKMPPGLRQLRDQQILGDL